LDAITPEVEPVDDHEDEIGSLEPASIIISSNGRPASALSGTRVVNYEIHKRRLELLFGLEERLIRLLSSPDEDEATHLGPVPKHWQPPSDWDIYSSSNSYPNLQGYTNGRPTPYVHIPSTSYSSPVSPQSTSTSYSPQHPSPEGSHSRAKKPEIAVHHNTNWKKAFALGGKTKSPKSEHTGEIAGWWDDPDDPVHVLNACAPAMLDLWKDKSVRERLAEKRIRLEESSGL
jgi:guanine nucleotide-binding protein subunit alpha